MTKAPDVTVVIPTRSRWRLLSLALIGALRQEDVEVEIVVVDDGSTDETPDRLAQIDDDRLVVIRRETSGGVATARNAGIRVARGGWIAFLDDDDLWSPRKLRAQLDAAGDAAWVYGAAVVIDEAGEVLNDWPAPRPEQLCRDVLTFNPMPGGCSNAMVRTPPLQALGGFDGNLSVLADWDLWIRLARTSRPARCPDVLVGYLHHVDNMHVQSMGRLKHELRYLIAKHGAAAPDTAVRVDSMALSDWMATAHRRANHRAPVARAYMSTLVSDGARRTALRRGIKLVRRKLNARRASPGPAVVPDPPDWLALYQG